VRRALKARLIGVNHMVAACGAKSQGATKALSARRVGATNMAEASGVESWGATRALKARRVGALNTVAASGAKSRGVKRALSARRVGVFTVFRVAEVSGARGQAMAPRALRVLLWRGRRPYVLGCEQEKGRHAGRQ
jgi:hypothetical protein